MKRTAFLFLLALIGCATDMQRVDREIGAGQPLQYKEGYKAGCDSGYVAAGHPYYRFNKDVARYGNDNLYKQGWDDGFSVCKGKYESIGRSLR
jgi:hypothetical protein